jgi:hypothetical protein
MRESEVHPNRRTLPVLAELLPVDPNHQRHRLPVVRVAPSCCHHLRYRPNRYQQQTLQARPIHHFHRLRGSLQEQAHPNRR